MVQSSIDLSANERKFLISLLEDGSKTDAQIAREACISKSTANRIRKDLQDREILVEYIPIVDLDKLGVEVFLILMFQWTAFKNQKVTQEILEDLENDPHVIFLAQGEGSEELTTCVFFGFKNATEYNEYYKEFRKKYEDFIGKTTKLLIPSNEIIKQDFTEMVKFILRGGDK